MDSGNFWNTQNFLNPMDLLNQWSNQWNSGFTQQNQIMQNPLNQLFDFGNVIRQMQEALQQQGGQVFSQEQINELLRLCSFNNGLSFMPPVGQSNPWTGNFVQNASFGESLPYPNQGFGNIPALGIGREWQEDLVEVSKLQQEFLEAYQSFLKMFSNFAEAVGENFGEALKESEMEKTGFHEVCSIWIDCCENEFQQIASTKEYSKLYGGLINAHLRLRKKSNEIQDKRAKLADQPTRNDLNAVQKECMEAKARIKQLESRIQTLEASGAEKKPATRARATRRTTKKPATK